MATARAKARRASENRLPRRRVRRRSGAARELPDAGRVHRHESTEEGPTSVVVGYWESGLDEAYNEWKDQVEEAGFNVTFDEIEDKDAEVAYEGSGKTGIVQLKDQCEEDEVTYVRITSRPE